MIQGKKINLRVIKEEDIDEMTRLGNNLAERGEYLGVELASENQFKKHFNENGWWNAEHGKMLITDKQGDIVGDISYFKGILGCDGYEVGCNIFEKENRGKGYACEALTLFSAYLFELRPIHRLEVLIFDGNVPSRKIAEKCGYVYEGTMRQAFFARGKYHDVQFFSILREECKALAQVISKN